MFFENLDLLMGCWAPKAMRAPAWAISDQKKLKISSLKSRIWLSENLNIRTKSWAPGLGPQLVSFPEQKKVDISSEPNALYISRYPASANSI